MIAIVHIISSCMIAIVNINSCYIFAIVSIINNSIIAIVSIITIAPWLEIFLRDNEQSYGMIDAFQILEGVSAKRAMAFGH